MILNSASLVTILHFFFSGDNATLSCKIGSVPSSKVRWYRDGTEVLNNSLVNAGLQRFVIYETGAFEKTSSLILTNARAEDSGPFMCVSQNQAGRVEANFTLQVKMIFHAITQGTKIHILCPQIQVVKNLSFSKIYISKNLMFDKIHIFKISFFTKFTFRKIHV